MYHFSRRSLRLAHIPAFAIASIFLMGANCCDLDGDGQCDDSAPCEDVGGHDDDLDGICSDVDNCPDSFNPEQVDSDSDGVGDICQEEPVDPRGEPFIFMGLGSYIGQYGGGVADIDGDGRVEILLSSDHGLAYSLEWDGEAYGHDQIFSAVDAVESVSSADLDGDGVHEVFLTSEGLVYRLDGATGQVEMAAPHSYFAIIDIELVDIDGDGELELVGIAPEGYGLYDESQVVVMDAATLMVEWVSGLYPDVDDLAIGDVLSSSEGLEIITNSGVVFGGRSKAEEWNYPLGFGDKVDTGDVSGDAQEEIVGIEDWAILTVFDANLGSLVWEANDLGNLSCLLVANVNDTPRAEIIIGPSQWGDIFMYDGQTQEEIWRIDSYGHGSTQLFYGDPDQDGSIEVLWGTGASHSGQDFLVVADVAAGEYDWHNPYQIDGSFMPGGLGDFNGDGSLEFLAASQSTSSGYEGSMIFVFDQLTHALIADTPSLRSRRGEHLFMATDDFDGDGVTDLAIANGLPFIELYDVFEDTSTWTSDTMSAQGHLLRSAEVGGEKVLVGAFGSYLHVFQPPATAPVLSTTNLQDTVYDFDFCDLNGDGEQDLVVAAQALWTFRVTPGLFIYSGSETEGVYEGVRCADLDDDGKMELVVWDTVNYYDTGYLAVLDAATLEVKAEIARDQSQVIKDLEVVDLEKDGVLELVIAYDSDPFNDIYGWVEIVDSITLDTLSATSIMKDSISREGLIVEDVGGDGDLNLEIGRRGTFEVMEMP